MVKHRPMVPTRPPTRDADGHLSVRPGSDRSFGFVFSALFLLVGLGPLRHGGQVRLWSLGLAAALLLGAFFLPAMLRPANLVWFRFGLIVHRLSSSIILAVLFFAVFTPAALLLRLIRRDALKLKADPAAASYWLHRYAPGPPPESMLRQF